MIADRLCFFVHPALAENGESERTEAKKNPCAGFWDGGGFRRLYTDEKIIHSPSTCISNAAAIKPCLRFSHTRLSEVLHCKACVKIAELKEQTSSTDSVFLWLAEER